ncbi:hypothetical protein GDO81_014629 [Engystomops pustulosus]|uniref:Uncharacterized protein n=1 Tax=Engystomops pustulosus TaxID=76066 RepID=A0AAV7BBN3_ENGPU|nr:hypothetical protein GDO81_014629 [Engystomops pustulosus]
MVRIENTAKSYRHDLYSAVVMSHWPPMFTPEYTAVTLPGTLGPNVYNPVQATAKMDSHNNQSAHSFNLLTCLRNKRPEI